MRTASTDALWAELARPRSANVSIERFDPTTLDTLPPPAARWLGRILPAGTPLVEAVEIWMSGEIKLGTRWMPFTARQILRASVGFIWAPTVGGRLVRFVGADLLGPDDARMEFRLHGLIPVVKVSGPDVARSAAGRLTAETVAWLPHATTPQTGARWTPIDDRHATVTLDVGGVDTDVTVGVDESGTLRSVALQRWNNSAEPPAFNVFGAATTSEHATPDGVRIAGSGAAGWGYGTPGWEVGEFFRFTVAEVDWIP